MFCIWFSTLCCFPSKQISTEESFYSILSTQFMIFHFSPLLTPSLICTFPLLLFSVFSLSILFLFHYLFAPSPSSVMFQLKHEQRTYFTPTDVDWMKKILSFPERRNYLIDFHKLAQKNLVVCQAGTTKPSLGKWICKVHYTGQQKQNAP